MDIRTHERTASRIYRCLLGSAVGVALGLAVLPAGGYSHGRDAISDLYIGETEYLASALLYEVAGGVQVSGVFDALPAGAYALTIQPGHDCRQGDSPALTQPATDLSPISLPDVVATPGNARPYIAVASGVNLSEGPRSLLGPDGSMLVMKPHPADDRPDVATTDRTWFACGIIGKPSYFLSPDEVAPAKDHSVWARESNAGRTLPAAGELPRAGVAGLASTLVAIGLGLRRLAP